MEELPTEPSGILIQPDFITPQHEQALIQIFQDLPWPSPATTTTTTTSNSNNPTKKNTTRRSLHWGHTFCYKTFSIDRAVPHKPFPPWLVPLIPRIPPSTSTSEGGGGDGDNSPGRDPDQVCLQHYPPGAGIPPHVDTHSAFDELYALSLGSPVVMQFREGAPSTGASTSNGNGDGGAGKAERRSVDVDLQPRSMMQMRGDARLHWTHGIRKRKTDVLADGAVRSRRDRWSITYRWLRDGGVCECGDEVLCDTAMRRRGEEREYRWKQQGTAQGMAQDTAHDELKDGVKEETVQT
ncbi:hypothetical protein N3K66_007158 [Trichothecium roseum]|uniref:Uncharacterized protein n=1 Tax=Trichothecium roseum TaxID=47278 RepID=A0ACC0UZ55_9HYPO|nr:hypothetical protein N3K66_007158 [Trichothecium roseum]